MVLCEKHGFLIMPYKFDKFAGGCYLEADQYVYSFECQLPLSLPTSFEGKYGHIRYDAKVVLIIPWGIDDSFRNSFTVIRSLDLNQLPQLRVNYF